MKVYIAHNMAAKESLRINVVPVLEKAGHEVTSSWLWINTEERGKFENAAMDFADVERAGAIIFFSEQYGLRHGRGKFIELGYAIRAGKKIIIVGENDGCVFYHLPHIRWARDIEEALKYL